MGQTEGRLRRETKYSRAGAKSFLTAAESCRDLEHFLWPSLQIQTVRRRRETKERFIGPILKSEQWIRISLKIKMLICKSGADANRT
jgi:hypothetical protein